MNKVKFLLLACFFTFAVSCSQQKRYITYKVKQGESMRDIANRLDIKTKELLKLNPDVNKKPKVNTTIIIPNPSLKKVMTSDEVKVSNKEELIIDKVISSEVLHSEEAVVNDSLKVAKISYEYVTHTVLAKETIYGITKKYNLSKKELLELNNNSPELQNNVLSIGQVLNVKSKEITTFISLEEDLKNYVTHVVKPKETVYGLTRFYNVTKDVLVSINPEYPDISNNYLKIGQILRIRSIKEKIDVDDALFYQDSIGLGTTIKLAVLLPFKSKSYDTVPSNDIFKKNKLTNMVTDFYMGAEIAMDSIKKQGIQLEVEVFDSGNRGEAIKGLLNSNRLKNVDVVIGPFYSNKAELVANTLKVPVVFPHYSNKQKGFLSEKLIKAEPDLSTHTKFLSSYLKGIYNGENIFVIGDGGVNSNEQIQSLTYNLKQHDSIHNIIVLKPEDGYIKKERFTDYMKPNSHSWVIIASNDIVTVADALNSMIVLPEEVTAQVFSIKKNKAFNNIDNNKLARVELVYVTNNFIDKSSLDSKKFRLEYERINNAMPSEYSIKGFDVTYDVLMRLSSGNTLFDTFKKGASLRLEAKFNYNKDSKGTIGNNGLFIVKYNKDLSINRLR